MIGFGGGKKWGGECVEVSLFRQTLTGLLRQVECVVLFRILKAKTDFFDRITGFTGMPDGVLKIAQKIRWLWSIKNSIFDSFATVHLALWANLRLLYLKGPALSIVLSVAPLFILLNSG